MELEKAIRGRRSVRAYTSKDVPQNLIDEAVEMASWAPSAGNLQSRDFVIVRDRGTKEELAGAALGQDFVAEAPVVIVVVANLERVADYGRRGRDLYSIQDAAAATQNLLLALHERGLGSVWVGSFEEHETAVALGLPRHARPVAIVPVGYPAEEPSPRDHLPKEAYVHFEKW